MNRRTFLQSVIALPLVAVGMPRKLRHGDTIVMGAQFGDWPAGTRVPVVDQRFPHAVPLGKFRLIGDVAMPASSR